MSIIDGDILIENGIIKDIKREIKSEVDKKINLNGKIVMGGVIDSHVHLRYGNPNKEDFLSGSLSAINGGITDVIDMPNSNPPTTTPERFMEKYNKGKKEGKVNIHFNYGITEKNYLDNIDRAKTYKIFMVKSVGDLFITDYSKLKDILNQNKLFTIHCEHKDVIDDNLKKYNLNSWEDHYKIRDKKSEVLAIEEVIKNLQIIEKMGKFKPHVHILHLSTKEGLELINRYRNIFKNVKITCEVCPHHLFLNTEMANELKGLGKFNPPLRDKEDNKYLIKGLTEGKIDTIATDHAPHTYHEKFTDDITKCPSGIPGMETLVPLILDLVNKKIISIYQFKNYLVDNPKNIFKINNEIKVGNVANISVLDLNKEIVIKGDYFKSKAKFTPFEGWKVKGAPIYTIVRGKLYGAYGYEYDINNYSPRQ